MSICSPGPGRCLLAIALSTALAAGSVLAAPAAPVVHPLLPHTTAPVADGARFIVQYRSTARRTLDTAQALAVFDAALAQVRPTAARAAQAPSRQVRTLATGARLIAPAVPLDYAQSAALLARLQADPAVAYAQADQRLHALDFTPNDPDYARQWHYHHPAVGIGTPQAWERGNGQGVVVAVLDTGYLDHQELTPNLVAGYDFISDPAIANDGDGRDGDARDPGDWDAYRPSSFHGTHVAGTVAAVTDNGKGVAGVAWGARVQPVRVLGTGGGDTSDIIDAIVWAAGGQVAGVPDNATPAEVINLSLGGPGDCTLSPATQDAIDTANAQGAIVVVAAGNANIPAAAFSPASCRGVITVGASDYRGGRAWYSNYGPGVHIAAPGGAVVTGHPEDDYVWSLGNTGRRAPDPSPAGDTIAGMIGTSMAAPHVAGVVAMMQSAAVAAGHPPLTLPQVRSVLRSTASPFPLQPPFTRSIGTGIVNAAAAVAAAQQGQPAVPSELLRNRLRVTAPSGQAGEVQVYRIDVPAGAAVLNLRSFGGDGDVSLYVARGRVPGEQDSDHRSQRAGTTQTVQVVRPQAGTWYVAMVGDSDFTDVSVMAIH